MLLSIPGGRSSITDVVWVCSHRGHFLGPARIEVNVSGLVEVSGLGLLLWRLLAWTYSSRSCWLTPVLRMSLGQAWSWSHNGLWLELAPFMVAPSYPFLWRLLAQVCSGEGSGSGLFLWRWTTCTYYGGGFWLWPVPLEVPSLGPALLWSLPWACSLGSCSFIPVLLWRQLAHACWDRDHCLGSASTEVTISGLLLKMPLAQIWSCRGPWTGLSPAEVYSLCLLPQSSLPLTCSHRGPWLGPSPIMVSGLCLFPWKLLPQIYSCGGHLLMSAVVVVGGLGLLPLRLLAQTWSCAAGLFGPVPVKVAG